MSIFLSLWASIVSVIATAIMSYICMATPIGPWIETTIILLTSVIVHIFFRSNTQQTHFLGLSSVAGGMGGIIATACGFSFPTLFFLQPDLFRTWLGQPLYFCAVMGGLVLTASALGLLIAHIVESRVLSSMQFSVGQLSQKMIVAQNQTRKAYELVAGIISSCLLATSQPLKILPSSLTLIPRISWKFITIHAISFKLDLLPMFLAIGFIGGEVLTVPLLVGVFSKFFIVEPLHTLAFTHVSYENFMLAFFSGIVVQSAFFSFLDFPALVIKAGKRFLQGRAKVGLPSDLLKGLPWYTLGTAALGLILFLMYFKFSIFAQIYLVVGSIVCTYQLIIIAGKIGIAPLGRFATFVMIPGLLIFGFNAVQATIVATFVEISGGVAVDALFGRKMGQLAHIKRNQIVQYQILGIAVSALCIGGIFWLLINHFGLQTPELFAQRAQSRAMLVQAYHFDYYIVILGALFGYILKYCKVNPVLVLGGLSMSVDASLMLVAGGLLASRLKNPEEFYSFWSGIFAASSIIMILRTII